MRELRALLGCLVLGAVLLFGWANGAWAQETRGTITGSVTDASGAVIPGAKVTITNTDRNVVVRTVTTGSSGSYSAPLLPVGRYKVTVEAPNFKKAEIAGVALHVSEVRTVNVALTVGAVVQSVTVTASPLQVQLQSVTASSVIQGMQVRQLPLNTRNYEQLVTLMPGVTTSNYDQLYIGTTNPTGSTNVVSFSVNGNRNSANNWTIDGADNMDRGSNLTLLDYPSVDAIAEFKVMRGLYNPEYGRAGGGQISVVTKSGTSSFHGDAYEFFRNDVLQGNNFFNNAAGIKRPPLRYNDFGYTIGGPAYIPGVFNTKKDKTFFFFSQEFRRVITYGTAQATVPTTAEVNGTFAHPVCVAFSGANGSGTCTQTANQVTAISPMAAAYIKDIWSKVPAPPSGNSLFSALRNKFYARQELVRIDQKFNDRWSAYGRYMHDSIPTTEPGGLFTGEAIPNVGTTNTNSPGYSWLVHLTATISPTLLNDFGYSYSHGAIISDVAGLMGTANSPDIHPNLPFHSTLARVPSVTLTGGSGLASFGPYRDYNRNHSLFETLTKVRNRHTYVAGMVYFRYEKTENAGGSNAGSFSFTNNGAPTGTSSYEQAWANFLQGYASSFSQASEDITPDIHDNQWEFYGQDTYQLRPNLTVVYGLRVSLFRQPTDANGQLTNFDPQLWDPAKAPQIDSKGNLIPGTGDPLNGIIIANQNSPYGSKGANEDSKNIAPRLGVSWDPFGDGKTAVRAGYGMFYDSTLFGTYEQNIFANPPFVQSIFITNTLFDNPAAGTPVVSLAPLSLHATALPNKTPYEQNWSLDVQRQLSATWLVDVGYYANKGTHLLGIIDINQVRPGLAAADGLPTITRSNVYLLNALRPYRGYNAINALENRFDSNYNSMQVSVQKRFAQNSLLEANYTWSHGLTDAQTDRSTAPQNTYNLRADYGPSQIDVRQVFTLDYVYDLPFFRSQHGFLGYVAGGWELSGIMSADTGQPLTIFTTYATDPGGLGYFGPSAVSGRPDQLCNPSSGAPNTIAKWFNTSCFANVPVGQVRPGNEPRGPARGPGFFDWDFGVHKAIPVHEAANLEFRADIYNVLNHTNFSSVGTTLGASTFGKVLSAHDPRVAQFALKFNF
jgi:hypothetical protein